MFFQFCLSVCNFVFKQKIKINSVGENIKFIEFVLSKIKLIENENLIYLWCWICFIFVKLNTHNLIQECLNKETDDFVSFDIDLERFSF